jgi:5-oxopent-3-ene-1,2,5-tricarboxylate decarboxylase/2-hydroxyhepta-2,4-diene-1,7-dioate isomerase
MKHARIAWSGAIQQAVEDDGRLRITQGPHKGCLVALDDVVWLPPLQPVSQARTVIALGLNYADHAKELAFKAPEEPLAFMKGEASLIGHKAFTKRPADVKYMHYECELAVVIGRTSRRVKKADAYDHIAGYSVANDYAIRDYLENWYRPNLRVKNRDTCTPIGPWLVDAADVPNPMALHLQTSVNGQVTQRRGDQMYTRADGAWQKSDGDGNRSDDSRAGATNGASGARQNQSAARTPDGSWRDGAARAGQRNGSGNFQERDDSPMASSQARNTNSDGFRPDPNHNFEGSPRGAVARGETNYATRGHGGDNGNGAQQGNGASAGGAYQRGGNFNGGGWGISDQGGTYAQRWGNDYDRGLPGFNQDTGWYDRTVSRPVNPYGYGY